MPWNNEEHTRSEEKILDTSRIFSKNFPCCPDTHTTSSKRTTVSNKTNNRRHRNCEPTPAIPNILCFSTLVVSFLDWGHMGCQTFLRSSIQHCSTPWKKVNAISHARKMRTCKSIKLWPVKQPNSAQIIFGGVLKSMVVSCSDFSESPVHLLCKSLSDSTKRPPTYRFGHMGNKRANWTVIWMISVYSSSIMQSKCSTFCWSLPCILRYKRPCQR